MPAIKRPNVKKMQAECDRFNAEVKVGDEVCKKAESSEIFSPVGYSINQRFIE